MPKLHKLLRNLVILLRLDRLYTSLLEKEVREGPIPDHVAVILDGNRRWAAEKGMARHMGYRYGAKKAEELLRWCLGLGVKSLTLYVLSRENLGRSKEELDTIFDVMEEKLEELERDGVLEREDIRFKVLGEASLLPKNVREKLERLESITSDHSSKFLNLAVCYSGRQEIVKAVREIVEEVREGRLKLEEIGEEVLQAHLYTSHVPDPDLIIRTSGEMRISGFLLWQSAYSELVFMDVYWPDFRKMDFLRAIRTFQKRKRRFGL